MLPGVDCGGGDVAANLLRQIIGVTNGPAMVGGFCVGHLYVCPALSRTVTNPLKLNDHWQPGGWSASGGGDARGFGRRVRQSSDTRSVLSLIIFIACGSSNPRVCLFDEFYSDVVCTRDVTYILRLGGQRWGKSAGSCLGAGYDVLA